MSTKISTKNAGAIAMVGVIVAAALMAAIAFSPTAVLARRGDEQANDSVGTRVTRGAGIATDSGSGENLRSGFEVMTQYDNSTGEHGKARRSGSLCQRRARQIRLDPRYGK